MANNALLARIARQNGGKLLNTAMDVLLPVDGTKTGKPSLVGGIVFKAYVPLRPEGLRRLDRVDAVLIDPRRRSRSRSKLRPSISAEAAVSQV